MRAAAARDAPRPEVRDHPNDDERWIEEDGVDRTSHEPRVNRCGRAKKEALSSGEWSTAEQAPETREGSLGHEAALAGDPTVSMLECDLHLEPHVDVVGVVAQRERWAAQAEQGDHLLRLQLGG